MNGDDGWWWRVSSLSFSNGNCPEVGTAYRKSSASNGQASCAEVGTDYRKPSASNPSGSCVEVASGVLVRDTKQEGSGPVLAFTLEAWRDFTASLKLGL